MAGRLAVVVCKFYNFTSTTKRYIEMSGPGIQLETLVKSVQELQTQKSYLELTLQEIRNKKRLLEEKVESITSRHGQVKDINTKMTETLKVAQHKVAQTHAQMTALENVYRENKLFVQEMTAKIEAQRRKQLNNTLQFESKLCDMSKKMKDARNFHSPDNLEKELQKVTARTEQLELETATTGRETEDLSEQLEEATAKGAKAQPEIAAGDQQTVFGLFAEEEEALKAAAEDMEDKQDELTERLKEVSQELSSIE